MTAMATRSLEPELMDDPALDLSRHRLALRGLERLNRWSGSARLVWSTLGVMAEERSLSSLRILDVASGAGDVPIGVWHRARRVGQRLTMHGSDRSRRAVEFAQARAAAAGAPVDFFELDVLRDPIPTGYDIIMSSLFLHHLAEAQVVDVLRRMATAARHLVLVNDLVRTVPGLALAYVGTRMLTRSDVVHADGPQSVRAAYTTSEVRVLADRAGLPGAVIESRWPCRFLLSWRRQPGDIPWRSS